MFRAEFPFEGRKTIQNNNELSICVDGHHYFHGHNRFTVYFTLQTDILKSIGTFETHNSNVNGLFMEVNCKDRTISVVVLPFKC